MKMKITLNPFNWHIRLARLTLIALIAMFSQSTFAQCSLACNSSTQVSLDAMCQAEVTFEMILNGNQTSCPDGEYKVLITDAAGNVIPGSPIVTDAHIGKVWDVLVRDTSSLTSQNECWGTITVEDKIAPTISCAPPTEPIFCFQTAEAMPVASDNCSAVVIEASGKVPLPVDCVNPDVIERYEQTFYAIDESGNVSTECTYTVEIRRLESLDTIDNPASLLLSNLTHLECDEDFAKLPDGNPSPVAIGGLPGTGVPMIGTTPLYPSDGLFCNLLTTFNDTRLPTNNCVTKIMRKWDVFEWSACSNPSRDTSYIQMIEIVDSEGPTYTEPVSFVGSTSGHDCEGYVVIPPLANLQDNCSDVSTITVDVFYEGGYLDNMNGGIAPVPVGTSDIIYVAKDACGNITSDTVQVTIEDLTPPVTVCDQNTTIGLTNGGEAWVNAITFDDGSYDDCALESFVVRRMDPTPCAPCRVPEFTEFTYLGERNGHHYYISKWAKSPSVAFRYAEALGGYVYSPTTSAENTAVNEFVKNVNNVDDYVIGLSDDSAPYTDFRWDDGSTSTYRNFEYYAHYYPNQYVTANVSSGEWDYADRSANLPFIVEIEDICGFDSYAKFCCEDNDNTDKVVVFRAIDAQGNYNDCMVNALIQDKVRPTLSCPADMTVNCDFGYDPSRLGDAFGMPTYVGNCDPIMKIDSITDLDKCNQGTIKRTFTLQDANGADIVSCDQYITFANNDPFDIYNDVRIPADREFIGACADPTSPEYLPSVTGEPTFINEDLCDLVGYNYNDQVFTFNTGDFEGTCFKILRTFTIIDWCSTGNQTTSYTQTIKVIDDVEPTIITECDPVYQCTYDAQCQSGTITLSQTANDTECSSLLRWTAIVNPFKSPNTSDDITFTGLDTTATITREFPIGTHTVLWTFNDECGNVTSCLQDFTIANCKAPTPYCLNGLAVDLMPIDDDNDGVVDYGEVELWASDFDAGSYHGCPGYEVVVSFTPDPLETNLLFTCDSMGDAQVRIYATAIDANGQYVLDTAGNYLQAYCNTFVSVQDNMNACGQNTRVAITGSINTSNGASLNEAEVSLMNGSTEIMLDITDLDGNYAFADMPSGGNYMVSPKKLDNPANGVSTLDLVLIQRHILGMQDLDGATKVIAADVNHDEAITGADIVTLRKLILGKISEYPNNDSWRFVDNSYQFVDATDPLNEPFREAYNISNLASDMDIDFTAVKIGDVNSSASFDGSQVSENRSTPVLLSTTGGLLNENGLLEFPVVLSEDMQFAGMQFTLNFDESIDIDNISSDILNITSSNMNITEGQLTFSFHSSNAISIREGEVLFTISYQDAMGSGQAFSLNSDLLAAEIYDQDLTAKNLRLEYRDNTDQVILYQNTPNPFMATTTVNVYMPNDANATLSIYDVTGKLLMTYNKSLTKGMNTISVSKDDLGASGVLFYTLRTNNFAATKRMVVMK